MKKNKLKPAPERKVNGMDKITVKDDKFITKILINKKVGSIVMESDCEKGKLELLARKLNEVIRRLNENKK